MKRIITDIQLEEEKSSSCTIYMDGVPFATVEVGFTTKLGLRIGLEIDEIALRKLIAADEVIKARDHALRLLLNGTYTKEQMIQALENGGFCDYVVNETLENLEHLGHIKDEKYAKNWVNNRRRTRPTSKMAMRRELTSQGVDKSTAERVLAEIDDADEAALALQLARKQANRYKSLAPHVVKRRLHAFLLRRGFDHETIGQVMRQVLTMEQSRQR
jgi:regulatory protein